MQKARAPSSPEPGSPTPERLRRSVFVVGPAVATEHGPARAGSRVHRSLSTLERLVRTGAINLRQADAGERLRDDFELGVAGAREPASGSVGTAGWYYADARLAAVRRYQDAIAAIGPLTPFVLLVVLGEPGQGEVSISDLARRLKGNRQEVAGIVKLGLAVLADHYEIDDRNS